MAVSDNVITGEMGFLNPGYYMAEGSIVDIALRLSRNWSYLKRRHEQARYHQRRYKGIAAFWPAKLKGNVLWFWMKR